MINKLLFSIILIFTISSCSKSSKQEDNVNNQTSKKDYSSSSLNIEDNDNSDDENTSYDDNNSLSDCEFPDGEYSAIVYYYNPDTDFSNTYTLYVDVEDCQVVQINFPKGGWLDEDHIDAADIDDNGEAMVYGEDGKTYDVQLDF